MMTYPLLVSLCISLIFNFLVYLVAYFRQTDKLTDATYSLTFILLASFFFFSGERPLFRILIFLMPMVWAIRLGTYLFFRILKKGRDVRFDNMRPVWWRFGGFWLLQALSVWIISLPFVLVLSKSHSAPVGLPVISMIGIVIYAIGLGIEWIADLQKSKFKRDNGDTFISTGIYSVIQYPNYLGEMMVWVGIFLYSVPILNGMDWLVIISPLWIVTLLTRISGMNLLRALHEEKYGDLKDYRAYVGGTAKLIPYIY